MVVLALLASTGALFGCGVQPQSTSAIVADEAPRALPEGHPPIPGFEGGPALPDGHPRCPARGVMGDSPAPDQALSPPRIIST
jgi:hypothetical protein